MREEGKMLAEQRSYDKMSAKLRSKKMQNDTHQKAWIWKISLGLLVVSLIIWCWSKLINPETFPINIIQIKGHYPHVDHGLLRQITMKYIQNGLIWVDANELEDRISHIDWVKSVRVKRRWPDALQISIEEQEPVAQISSNVLVNKEGDLFTAKRDIPANLPLFVGGEGQQKLMLQMYQQMQQTLIPLGVQIAVVTLDSRLSWQIQLKNGLIILIGQADPLKRWQRFLTVYRQITVPKLAMIQSVDLRYANGIAVHFKGQSLQINSVQEIV